jgi:hypothetical protein
VPETLWGVIWVLVPIAAVIGWVVVATTKTRARQSGGDQLTAVLAQTAETNRLLTERIDQMDKRLASIEKTLNEIP